MNEQTRNVLIDLKKEIYEWRDYCKAIMYCRCCPQCSDCQLFCCCDSRPTRNEIKYATGAVSAYDKVISRIDAIIKDADEKNAFLKDMIKQLQEHPEGIPVNVGGEHFGYLRAEIVEKEDIQNGN